MNPATFFYKHAPFSYDPRLETEEQGKRRRSRELADAERWAENTPFLRYEWFPLPGRAALCGCNLWDGKEVAAYLYDIHPDASDEDRRVIEAELALEVMPRRKRHVPSQVPGIFGAML